MARFFKYKSVADLIAENQRLGLDLRFSEDFAPLFAPLAVGPFEVGNRFCIHPMEGCDGELDGQIGELTRRRYLRFAAGGAKIIWGEATAIHPEARANPRQILLNESTYPAFEQLVRDMRQTHAAQFGHADDLLIGLQLTHSGRYAYQRPLIATHDPLLDPRTIVDKSTGQRVDDSYAPLSDAELEALVPQYVQAARLAYRAGFDFVDVKQCHRYLLNELLGARNRPGKFGGSLENRTHLPRMIMEAIRAEFPGRILATRINAFDGIPFNKSDGEHEQGVPAAYTTPVSNGWGLNVNDPLQPDLHEMIWWLGEMKRIGVELVNITLGNPYAQPHFGRPFEYPPPDGYEAPEHPLIGVDRHFRIVEELQRAHPDLPLIGTGYSYLQEFLPHAGAANVRDGRVMFVGVGRASLSQPDFVRQLLEHGKFDRKRICRTFSYCTALMRAKHNELGQFPSGCPPFDKEVYGSIWQDALTIKKAD